MRRRFSFCQIPLLSQVRLRFSILRMIRVLIKLLDDFLDEFNEFVIIIIFTKIVGNNITKLVDL